MITYPLDLVAQEWALERAMDRSGSMKHSDTIHSINMLKDRPPYWRHYVGVLGELCYAWFSGQKVDIITIGRGDDGTDFPDGVQVKSSDLAGNRPPRLMLNPDQWRRKRAFDYVLAWIQWTKPTPKGSLLGWISHEEFAAIHKIDPDTDRGLGACMFVTHEQLHSMATLSYEIYH